MDDGKSKKEQNPEFDKDLAIRMYESVVDHEYQDAQEFAALSKLRDPSTVAEEEMIAFCKRELPEGSQVGTPIERGLNDYSSGSESEAKDRKAARDLYEFYENVCRDLGIRP